MAGSTANGSGQQFKGIKERGRIWVGEAPAEPKTTAGRRPPEAVSDASGGRRAKLVLGSAGASPSHLNRAPGQH